MNQAEGIIHDTETKMEEFKDQLPTDEVRTVTKFCKFLLAGDNPTDSSQTAVVICVRFLGAAMCKCHHTQGLKRN